MAACYVDCKPTMGVHHFNCPNNPYGPRQCITCGVSQDDPNRTHSTACFYRNNEWFWGYVNGIPQAGVRTCGANNGLHGKAWTGQTYTTASSQPAIAASDATQKLPPIINTKGNLGVIEEQDHSYLGYSDRYKLRHRGGRKIEFPI